MGRHRRSRTGYDEPGTVAIRAVRKRIPSAAAPLATWPRGSRFWCCSRQIRSCPVPAFLVRASRAPAARHRDGPPWTPGAPRR